MRDFVLIIDIFSFVVLTLWNIMRWKTVLLCYRRPLESAVWRIYILFLIICKIKESRSTKYSMNVEKTCIKLTITGKQKKTSVNSVRKA